MSGNIFFLGNALLDMSICCNHSVLQVYNLRPDENCEATKVQDPLFEFLLNCSDTLLSPGGSAQNSSRVAQWVLNSYGKGQAIFAGCIGNDAYGKKLKTFMHESKVQALYHCHPSAPTGITAALVTDDGKRSLCARLGAAQFFDQDFLFTPERSSVLTNADCVYIEGYFISHSHMCALKVAKMVSQSEKILVFNLSGVYICENYYEQLNSCILMADIVIGNKQEAEAFVQKHRLPNETVETCAKMIASLRDHQKPQTVIITQGPDPVVVYSGDSLGVQFYDVPPLKVLGDTIGCGDAFVGGFLALLSLGNSTEESVKHGIHCATLIAQQRGCTIPAHDYE